MSRIQGLFSKKASIDNNIKTPKNENKRDRQPVFRSLSCSTILFFSSTNNCSGISSTILLSELPPSLISDFNFEVSIVTFPMNLPLINRILFPFVSCSTFSS